MLVGNGVRNGGNPFRQFGGAVAGSINRGNFGLSGALRNIHLGEATVISGASISNKNGFPSGGLHPGSWSPPIKAGGVASRREAQGVATLVVNLAGGKAAESAISGAGTLTATGELVVSGEAVIAGAASITANAVATLAAVSAISGQANITATLDAIGYAVSAIGGSATVSITSYATGTLEAEITPFTELSPQNLAAAVWQALSASYNDSGTMGEKLNGAASAGDPWSTALPGAYGSGTAGHIIGNRVDAAISTRLASASYDQVTINLIAKILKNKTVTDPSTGVMTVYDDDDTSVLLQTALYEDVSATQPYRGQGAERRDRLA